MQPISNYKSEIMLKFIRNDLSECMRKRSIGDWVNLFEAEDNEWIDRLCRERCNPAALTFQFEE